MSPISLAEGSVFAGRYRIVRSIAQGGMGAVYEVVHTETQRRRALKVMLPNMLQSQDMRFRFRQEACVTANIESEHIVDVLDAGIDENTQMPFLVMELLRGEELDKRLKRLGRLDPREVVTYLHHVALALDKTHRASIVHRDLKPGNVFLTEREDGSLRAKILDFGVAKLMAEGATSAGATQSLGTPLYMAPEQFHLGQKVSPAVDIFSLGMMAYTLLVGVSYWKDEISAGANIYAFTARAMHGPKEMATARAMRQGAPLPSSFDAWFLKATAPLPQDRFPTASSAIAALAEVFAIVLGSEKASSLPSTPPTASTLMAPRASFPSLNAPIPETLGDMASGGVRITDGAETIPLGQASTTTERPAITSPLPVAGHMPASPVEPSSIPTDVAESGILTTTGVKDLPRRPLALALAAVTGSFAIMAGASVFLLLRGNPEPLLGQSPEEPTSAVDAHVPETARSISMPEAVRPSAPPIEVAPKLLSDSLPDHPEPQSSATASPAVALKPSTQDSNAGAPSAALSSIPSTRLRVASGQGSNPPPSSSSKAPTVKDKKPAIERD